MKSLEVINEMFKEASKSKVQESVEFCGFKFNAGDECLEISYGNESISLEKQEIIDLLSVITSVKFKRTLSFNEWCEIIDDEVADRLKDFPKSLSTLTPDGESFNCWLDEYKESHNLRMEDDDYEKIKDKYKLEFHMSYDKFEGDPIQAKAHISYSLFETYDNCFKNMSCKYRPYHEVIDYYYKHADETSSKNNWIFKHIPTSGEASTMAAELVRNLDYVIYRWFNDGDTCLYYQDANLIPAINIMYYLYGMESEDQDKLINAINDYWSKALNRKFDFYKGLFIAEEFMLNQCIVIMMGLLHLLKTDKNFLIEKEVINLRSDETLEYFLKLY